jgi:hypothetical protein
MPDVECRIQIGHESLFCRSSTREGGETSFLVTLTELDKIRLMLYMPPRLMNDGVGCTGSGAALA